MSSAPCFRLCMGDYLECACPDITSCSKCLRECYEKKEPPGGLRESCNQPEPPKKKRLSLRDIGDNSTTSGQQCVEKTVPKKKRLSLRDIGNSSTTSQQCAEKTVPKKKQSDLRDTENSSSRFEFLSKEDAEDLQKDFVPANTERSTKWAMKVCSDWKEARVGDDCPPDDLLERADATELVKWLSCSPLKREMARGIIILQQRFLN